MSSFANRRKPRKVGADDDGEQDDQDSEPVVKRPAGSKTKQKSKLRLSFGPGETSMTDDGERESEVITPKRHGLGRRALEKSAAQQSASSRLSEQLPVREGLGQDRPSYSNDYLKELRESTPSTPKTSTDEEQDRTVNVAAKFGEVMKVSAPSAIPGDAEIREKKARRARLAHEKDYISLDDPAGDEELAVANHENGERDTRLLRDDEDFAEGFDDFVEDGRISLGRKAEREQRRRHREEMQELIHGVEGPSDEEDSDLDEKAAYEATQTRAAMGKGRHELDRPRTPPKMTSLPRLANNLERLRITLAGMEQSKGQMVNRMEELRKEKADIAVREVEIQALIKEAGENYEKLKLEAGVTPGSEEGASTPGDRGLENLGTPMITSTANSDNEG